MIIAEYTLDHPILRELLRTVRGIELTWEDSYTTPDGRMQMIIWIRSDDDESVEPTMRDDPTVSDPTLLTEVADRRLYRVELVNEGRETSIMPVVVEVGGVHQELVATRDGWRNRTRFPNREAFERVYRFCRDNDIAVTFESLYEPSERYGEESAHLTDAQRETLLAAVESGYLEIPRECSLAELGERLGISQSAASERFRRAVKRLVEETIHE